MDNKEKELEAKADIDAASINIDVEEKEESEETQIEKEIEKVNEKVKAPKATAKKGGKKEAEKVVKLSVPRASAEKRVDAPKVSDAAAEKVGKKILEANPDMQEVHMAADGRAFYQKNDADNHARTLKNRVVTTVTR